MGSIAEQSFICCITSFQGFVEDAQQVQVGKQAALQKAIAHWASKQQVL